MKIEKLDTRQEAKARVQLVITLLSDSIQSTIEAAMDPAERSRARELRDIREALGEQRELMRFPQVGRGGESGIIVDFRAGSVPQSGTILIGA